MSGTKLLDTVKAREQLGGISHVTIYKLIGSGELRSVKIGARRFIPSDAIEEYIASLAERSYPAAEVARLTDTPVSEVTRLIKSGDITVTRDGGKVRISQRQLDVLLGGNT